MAWDSVCTTRHGSSAGVICPNSFVPSGASLIDVLILLLMVAFSSLFHHFLHRLSSAYMSNSVAASLFGTEDGGKRSSSMADGLLESKVGYSSTNCCKTAGRIGCIASRLPLVLRPVDKSPSISVP